MVSAVISDLHLGALTEKDLLRRPEIRRRLIAELEAVDHVVLLGDSIELRDGPVEDALAAAAPFFEELGEALAGRRVTIVAGNHDHQLVWPWLARRRGAGSAPALALEQLWKPLPGDPIARLTRRLGGTEAVLAYPGTWLRPDVYATHGHYLDCHNPVATFECLARAACERLTGEPRNGYRTPDDYEAVLTPVYRAIQRVAQSPRARAAARAGKALVRRWESAAGYRGPRRRPGLAAMREVLDRLEVEAGYVLFGHLHHAGPLDGDEPAWMTAAGTRLVNTGSWVYEPAYLGAMPVDSPHWPGTLVLVRGDGPPQVKQLLNGLGHADLGAPAP